MKIKRYFAPDMRRAIRMVREEQGPDAVILSNRKVNGGVEIVSAIDYDADLVANMADNSSEAGGGQQRSSQVAPASTGSGAERAPDISAAAARLATMIDRAGGATVATATRKPLPQRSYEQRAAAAEMPRETKWLQALKKRPQEQDSESLRPEFPVPPQFQRPTQTTSTPKLTPIVDRTSEINQIEREALLANESMIAPPPYSQNSHGLKLGAIDEPERSTKKREAVIEWSQDPAIVEMRKELQMLREIMNDRIGGIAWGEKRQTHPLYVRFMQYMMRIGISTELADKLAENVTFGNNMGQNLRKAMGYLASQIQVTHDDILTHGGRIALLGSTGAGKTTSIAKLAARYTLRHGSNRVALVTTDCYRIGAYKQLQTYGRILGISVHVANHGDELQETLQMLQSKDLVLIDTAGISVGDERFSEQLTMLEQCSIPIRTYVTLAANSQGQVQARLLKAYSEINIDGIIVTKADETEALGESLSVAVKEQIPIAYICDGQMVPEDIHPARSNNLVNRAIATIKQAADLPDEQSVALAFAGMAGESQHG
ncbi:flagellar biosynthesis protein FlhF [Ectothiorhodospiraceae bacterium BW-2]|nr:flagellar biosynthesis protein FlhF [Ectothiorhodospiraceae bacterium BW-2]